MSDKYCKMKLVSLTSGERIIQIIEEWKKRYHISEQTGGTYTNNWARMNLNTNGWLMIHNWGASNNTLDTESIYEEFLVHGDTLTLEKIVEILGGPSNFAMSIIRLLHCDICKRYDREQIVMFQEIDCDGWGDVAICLDCLQAGAAFCLGSRGQTGTELIEDSIG